MQESEKPGNCAEVFRSRSDAELHDEIRDKIRSADSGDIFYRGTFLLYTRRDSSESRSCLNDEGVLYLKGRGLSGQKYPDNAFVK